MKTQTKHPQKVTLPHWPFGFAFFHLLEYLQQIHQIFVLFGEWIVIFTFYLPTFSNTLSNRFSITFSISFKYYFFIHYLFFFNNYTSSNIFLLNYYNRKKKTFEEWTIAHQTWWVTVHEPKKFHNFFVFGVQLLSWKSVIISMNIC